MMALQLESRLRVPHSHQSPANNIYKEDTAPNFNGSALLKCNSFTSSLPARRLSILETSYRNVPISPNYVLYVSCTFRSATHPVSLGCHYLQKFQTVLRFHSFDSQLGAEMSSDTLGGNTLCEPLSRVIFLCKTFVLGARKRLDNRSRWFILAGIRIWGVEGRDASWVRQSGCGTESEFWCSPRSGDSSKSFSTLFLTKSSKRCLLRLAPRGFQP